METNVNPAFGIFKPWEGRGVCSLGFGFTQHMPVSLSAQQRAPRWAAEVRGCPLASSPAPCALLETACPGPLVTSPTASRTPPLPVSGNPPSIPPHCGLCRLTWVRTLSLATSKGPSHSHPSPAYVSIRTAVEPRAGRLLTAGSLTHSGLPATFWPSDQKAAVSNQSLIFLS